MKLLSFLNGLLGMFVIIGLAFLISNNKKRV
jgi:nucleoside permease NupC